MTRLLFVATIMLGLIFPSSSFSQSRRSIEKAEVYDTLLIEYLIFSKFMSFKSNFPQLVQKSREASMEWKLGRGGKGFHNLIVIRNIQKINGVDLCYFSLLGVINFLFGIDTEKLKVYFIRYNESDHFIYKKDFLSFIKDQKEFIDKLNYYERLSLYMQLTLPKNLIGKTLSDLDSTIYLFPMADLSHQDSVKLIETLDSNIDIKNIQNNKIAIYNRVFETYEIYAIKEKRTMFFDFYLISNSGRKKTKSPQTWNIEGLRVTSFKMNNVLK